MTELTDALRELLEAYEARYPNAEAGMDAQTAWVMRQSRAREYARSLLASQAKQAAPIEQITPGNTDGVNAVVAPQPWDNAAAYEAWLLRHWPNNAQARAIYHNEMNTRAAFVAGAEWERTRGVGVGVSTVPDEAQQEGEKK